MTEYLLVNGPCHGQWVVLPEGARVLKVLLPPEPPEHVTEATLDTPAKPRVGFYVRRDAYSLEWQPEPH